MLITDYSFPLVQFCKDINIKISFPNVDVDTWQITNTDDPNTMLLLGTDVDGSCLNVNGVPSTTQCLLSYLLDGSISEMQLIPSGKNKAACLTDNEGTVQARCILRLLLQKASPTDIPKVYLFLEKIYCKMILNNFLSELSVLFQTFATQLAEELGIPLVSVREGYEKVGFCYNNCPYPKENVDDMLRGGPLYSADGHCIHEYVDAIKTQYSFFSIPAENCKILWQQNIY